MSVAVGIDLGTTNTVVGALRDGFPVTLVDEGKRRLLPSIVSFHPSGKVLVGHSARERRIVDATSTVFSVKRLIGRSWDSPEVQRARLVLPFELAPGDNHEATVVCRGERYSFPEISAFILRRAKAIAEKALGEGVEQAVITVPANFNDPQREATKLAGKLAGLEVLRIVSEPTAAALAYGESLGKRERVAVYDLGGGTFDVTLIEVLGSVFQVIATGGDTALGGDDLDELLALLMNDGLLRQHRFDARTDPTARAMLKARAEELKILLSSNAVGEVSLSNLVRGEGGQFLPASFRLGREVLEQLAAPLLDRTFEACRKMLEKVGMTVKEVDRILLVGGSTRMPLVGIRVEDYFGRKVSARVNPDEVVAHGAAIQAAALSRGGEAGSPSFRPMPSFAFALDTGGLPSSRPTPRVGDVTVPHPPKVPHEEPPARASAPPPSARSRASAPPLPRTEPGDVPAASASSPPSGRVSSPPLSQDQEELLRAFLGVEAPPEPPRSSKAPKSAAVESELLAFLSDAPPPPSPSEGIVPVFDQPAPLPLTPHAPDAPDLDIPARAHSTRPERVSVVPSVAPRPSPVISDRPSSLVVSTPSRPVAPSAPPLSPASLPPTPVRSPLLIDVTPLNLGVETVGGFCDVVIPANSPVPCERNRTFRTASDNQTAVVVRICQGESERFEQNTTLGDLRLSGFRAALRGEVEVVVTFEIDADGILNVQAKEGSTGQWAQARIVLLGAEMDAKKVAAMMDRQARREVA